MPEEGSTNPKYGLSCQTIGEDKTDLHEFELRKWQKTNWKHYWWTPCMMSQWRLPTWQE